MQIYWRMIEELRDLGEMMVFHDPSLLREYRRWCRRNKIDFWGTLLVGPSASLPVILRWEE